MRKNAFYARGSRFDMVNGGSIFAPNSKDYAIAVTGAVRRVFRDPKGAIIGAGKPPSRRDRHRALAVRNHNRELLRRGRLSHWQLAQRVGVA